MKKKIVFVITSLNSGGAERVLANLVNTFSIDFEVHLILLYNEPLFYKLDQTVTIHYLKANYTPSKTIFHALALNIYFIRKLIKIFRLNKYAVVIGFTKSVNVLSVISAKYLSVPCIISERNNPLVSLVNPIWNFLQYFIYSFSDALVVQTNFNKENYQKKLNSDIIAVIPNPISEDFLSLRKFYGERANVILTVGRLDKNKNQRLLIEAFANLNVGNWKLIIVGDGVLRNDYIGLTASLGIADKVEFVGNVSNVWDYYNQAKIFAFTSNSEGFPNALLEAMSFGLPCISTDCDSGPAEIIINDESGYLIEINNRMQLEDRLSQLINNQAICDKFSQNAISTTQKFNMFELRKLWEVEIQKLL